MHDPNRTFVSVGAVPKLRNAFDTSLPPPPPRVTQRRPTNNVISIEKTAAVTLTEDPAPLHSSHLSDGERGELTWVILANFEKIMDRSTVLKRSTLSLVFHSFLVCVFLTKIEMKKKMKNIQIDVKNEHLVVYLSKQYSTSHKYIFGF